MFDINTCKWVIWGAKRPYNTFGHIHEAFLRALMHLGKDVRWLEHDENISGIDFSNTLFLSMNCVIQGMPRRRDCFYIVHNVQGDPSQSYFDGLTLLNYGIHITTTRYSPNVVEIGPESFFDRTSVATLNLRWGTDLFPHEIEANKPKKAFNDASRVCTFIGSIDDMKQPYLQGFSRAVQENGYDWQTYGGHGGGRQVSIEEHIRIVKDSYMSPAMQGRDQVEQGYISCRLFKNISYGQMGLTCAPYANELFHGKLICNPDAHQLFYDARERLQSMRVE